jgi:putative ABC transport system ATP-binding protein
MNIVELSKIKKSYKGKHMTTVVFENLSLQVAEGEFLVIQGKSGSGKTTLLNIIGLLDHVDEGEQSFLEERVSNISFEKYPLIRNEFIGFVFQDFKLIPDMTVYENIEVPLAFSKNRYKRAKKKAMIMEWITAMDLNGKERAYPDELSGGQKQRVAIARAIVNHPKMIIADEPTGNLDEHTSNKIMEIFNNLYKERKITIVVVTHDNSWEKYATRVVDIKDL